jgi:translation elongation factor EF-G
MNVEVYAPSDFAGDLMGDRNSRRGRIAAQDRRKPWHWKSRLE